MTKRTAIVEKFWKKVCEFRNKADNINKQKLEQAIRKAVEDVKEK